MTVRVTLPPQDFNKMCKQAERDQEAKKLTVLMERVKRQIAQREKSGPEATRDTMPGLPTDSGLMRLPSRSALFER